MSTMDFGSALGGAGGAPPGMPPGLGAGPDAGPPPPDAPPDDGGGQGEDFATGLEALQVAEEALQAFIRLDPDHSDRAVAAQCLQNVLKLQAANRDNAKEGGLMSMARAIQGGPEANAGMAGGTY